MPFFFSKKPASVAQELTMVRDGAAGGPRHSQHAGAVDAFEVELLGHLDTLYGVSCRMTKSTTEAEDLVQDTVVKAMRARDQFEPGTNLKAWLIRILTNTFINRYRRGGLERDLFDGPDADSLTDGWVGANTLRAMRDPETQALTPIVEAEVQRALDDLPADFRLAVVLSDIEELSYKEIAEAMNCPIGTVMSRLHRGRKMLQKTLREHAVAMGIVSDDPLPARATDEAPTDSCGLPPPEAGCGMKSASARVNDCARFDASLAPYVDGELDACHAMDLDAHVSACGACAERVALARAVRTSLKQTATRPAPDALRARVCAQMVDERRRAHDEENDVYGPRLIRLRYAVGLAAAAGVVFAMGMSRDRHHVPTAGRSDTVAQQASFDTLLDDLVALHANPLPPETTDPEDLRRWDPFVGVPVRRPAFQPFGASFSGARVHAMADSRAALLQYTISGGHRVTVYVFNPRSVPVLATRLAPRFVRQQEVYIGTLRGYSVAAAERSGVGYALASDLDDDKSAQMMVAALQP